MNSPSTKAPFFSGPPSAPAALEEAWLSMRHVQRAAVFMKSSGMDAEALLREGGLAGDELTDGDRKVPLQVMEAILSAAEHRYGDPLLGLHMADDIQPATLGALGHVLQACGTLGELVDVGVRFNGLMSNFGRTSVIHSPGLFEVRWDCLAGSPLLRRHACEYILGTFAVLAKLLAPHAPGPIAVQFPHARPDRPERVKAYFDFFGCPVYFDRPYASITRHASSAHCPLPHGDAVLKDLLERHADHLLSRRAKPVSLVEDVRRLLGALLLAGTPTKESVALQLGMSTRSLHRRLDEAGTSYGEQLDVVRLSLAVGALEQPDTPIADIVDRLGFSSPQAFMRWFRQQTGVTPSRYRGERAAQASAQALRPSQGVPSLVR